MTKVDAAANIEKNKRYCLASSFFFDERQGEQNQIEIANLKHLP